MANELLAPAGVPDQAMDLQRCLLRLPPEQREVLLLVTLQDLGYEDAARITGVPIGTVMSRLSRARGAPARPDGRARAGRGAGGAGPAPTEVMERP